MSFSSGGKSTTVTLLLLDGTAEGLRLIEKSNWNGLAMMCSRSRYPAMRNREEFNLPGVYLLRGATRDPGGLPTLYIGQADSARERLDNHNRAKEFWSDLAVFTNKYGHLNKAHVLYLESRLIELAQQAKRAEMLNGNAPRLPFLSESGKSDSEAFLEQVLLLCPLLGLDYFSQGEQQVKPPRPVSVVPKPVVVETSPEPLVTRPLPSATLRLTGPGASASGRLVEGGFEVFEGGLAREEMTPSTAKGYVRLREQLVANGTLARSPEGLLVLTKNHTFSAPSAAAVVLLGRPANGLLEWKDEKGGTLKDLQNLAGERIFDVQ